MLRSALASLASVLALASFGGQKAEAQVFGTGPWSGLYLGAHAGYSAANGVDTAISGGGYGLQAGYNLQIGALILGVEADRTWLSAQDNGVVPGSNVSASIDGTWSMRGRLGFTLLNSLMFYGTAGIGGFDVGVKGFAVTPIGNVSYTGSAKSQAFVAGGGAELLLTRNIVLRLEGLYFMGDGTGLVTGNTDIAVGRAAISYKF